MTRGRPWSGWPRWGGSHVWLTRLPGGETLVAHVPHDELHGAKQGDEVWIDLRNPKAFGLEPERHDAVVGEAPDVVAT